MYRKYSNRLICQSSLIPSPRIPSDKSSKSNSSSESSLKDPGIIRVAPVVLLMLIGLNPTVCGESSTNYT
jgi:hypothetical protein